MNQVKGVRLGGGEQVIKIYEACRLSPISKGYFVVTNRRIIFVGEKIKITGKKTFFVRDVKMDAVNEVITYVGSAWNWLSFVAAVFLAFMFVGLGSFMQIFYFGFILPVFLLLRMLIGHKVEIRIITGGHEASSIGVSIDNGALVQRFFHVAENDKWISITAMGKGKDTELLMKELGALILDIQTMGDHVIAKWSPDFSEEESESASTQSEKLEGGIFN